MAADPDRRIRFLERVWQRAEAIEAIELALEAGDVLGPHRFQNAQLLVRRRTAAGENTLLEAKRFELFAHPADANAEIDSAT